MIGNGNLTYNYVGLFFDRDIYNCSILTNRILATCDCDPQFRIIIIISAITKVTWQQYKLQLFDTKRLCKCN